MQFDALRWKNFLHFLHLYCWQRYNPWLESMNAWIFLGRNSWTKWSKSAVCIQRGHKVVCNCLFFGNHFYKWKLNSIWIILSLCTENAVTLWQWADTDDNEQGTESERLKIRRRNQLLNICIAMGFQVLKLPNSCSKEMYPISLRNNVKKDWAIAGNVGNINC